MIIQEKVNDEVGETLLKSVLVVAIYNHTVASATTGSMAESLAI